MAIQFLGSNGFITRLGVLGDLFNQVVAFSGDTFYLNQEGQHTELLTWRGTDYGHILKTLDQHIASIAAQFTDAADRDLKRAIYTDMRDQLRDTSRLRGLVNFCHQLVIETASRDASAELSLAEAWREIIRQMKAQGKAFAMDAGTIPEPRVATVEAPQGDPAILCSCIAPSGIPRAFVFSEDLRVTCTNELTSEFTIRGQDAEPDPLSGNWSLFRNPASTVQGGGSGNDGYVGIGGDGSGSGGSSPTTNAVSRLTSGSGCLYTTRGLDAAASANLLANGSFDTFGSGDANAQGTPASWTVLAGSPGPTPGVSTDLGPTADGYATGRALLLVGQSSPTYPNLLQTLTNLKPSTIYAVNAWMRQGATTAAGVIQFRLIDGNGNVIADDAGTANALAATANSNIGTMPQVVSVSLSGTWTTGDVVTISLQGAKIAVTIGNGGPTTATTAAADIASAWNASTLTAFARWTASSSGTTLTLTADSYKTKIITTYQGAVIALDIDGAADAGFGAFEDGTSAIGTNYWPRSGFFRTPSVLPAVLKFQILVTTAITNTKSIYLDHLALAEAEELYTGGPWLKVFTGATPAANGDAHAIHVTNGNPNQYPVAWLERVFGLREMGIYPPFANTGSLNISDMLMGVQNT